MTGSQGCRRSGENRAFLDSYIYWNSHIKVLHDQGVNPPFDRWHVTRAEQYLRSTERRLRDHRQSDLEAWLAESGRNTAWKDWQIRQAVDAIHRCTSSCRLFNLLPALSLEGRGD